MAAPTLSFSSTFCPKTSTSTSASSCFSSSPKSRSTHILCSLPHLPRRLALPLLGLSLFLAPSPPALAKDVPLFGIRKRVEKVEEAVVKELQELVKEGGQEVTQLVKEGEKEVGAVAGAVSSFAPPSSSSASSLPPEFQAGAVAGAELVAVLVASSVVNGLVSGP